MRHLSYRYSACCGLESASHSNLSLVSYPLLSFLISESPVNVSISTESDCFLKMKLFQIRAQHEIERQVLKLVF